MPPMRAAPIALALALAFACLLAGAALLAGCGGGSETDGSSPASGESATSRPAPPKSAFPGTFGRSLSEVIRNTDSHSELKVEPAALAFYEGGNRYPFGVLEGDGRPIDDAEVALYIAKVPPLGKGGDAEGPRQKGAKARASQEGLDARAIGPFPARIETLATEPRFQAKTTLEDPDAAGVVYSAPVNFPTNGEWRVAAVIREGEETSAKLLPSVEVGEFSSIPRPGQPAPRIHTPTAEDVGGDLSKITTRIPPDRLNEVDYAQALGKEPILLLFATPKFCQSRVCGPVVDVAEQAEREFEGQAAFIHMEIYNDNDPSKDVRPQVRAFHLPSEPWLFAIDRQGLISAAIEGPFGLQLIDSVANRVVGE
jgi:hypothetical protein